MEETHMDATTKNFAKELAPDGFRDSWNPFRKHLFNGAAANIDKDLSLMLDRHPNVVDEVE